MKLRKMITLATLGLFFLSMNTSYAEDIGTQTLVDTSKDPKSKYSARYDPNYSSYCSATIISKTTVLTAKHCAGNKRIDTYIGAVYPGQSGLNTPFGKMNISSYIPNDDDDIAILKGSENDMDNTYKHYMKDANINITPFNKEALQGLVGKKVYSYGYPAVNLTGYKQYKSEGVITKINQVTGEVTTNMPVISGQSGSGVFLEEEDRFLGVIHSASRNSQGENIAIVTPMNKRLTNWFNKNK
ncbi:trypsin-like serine peptidase [Staphylococcus aureus]|uniref:trypsin-like serine peptidase n=1 Tax=Staphylococcus aureus TaxID=1280 RepID=UPI0018E926F0|nr:trypsin-like serine protease [Staphylococcus aureus]MBJ6234574.1 trypsin-like serine protease [Staphylococcus aureus]MBJ6252669.1 trypsin-like serine protease [Staphylococcus aureus]MBJ6291937.1 trypsin-like serine protease [Staphylococcus aureus]MBJ6342936.1 trypsin-like serine protease [Staphylococcus aureus]MBJ6359627.1 trypsin-like serine protease [Staphylococcus aureus]